MSDHDNPVLTDEEVVAKWEEISPLIDAMMGRVGDPGNFRAPAGTSLAGDDRASDPYHLSHALQVCLTAGVDHLHAAKRLVVDLGDIHVAAPASLARGALENFATAYWMLAPSSRADRVERVLRWHAQNARDREKAHGTLPLEVRGATLEQTALKLDFVAGQIGIPVRAVRAGYRSTEVVEFCEERLNGDGKLLGVLFPWRLCSGFAHGRPWAYLGASNVTRDVEEAGVIPLRLTSDLTRALWPVLAATHLLQDFLRLHQQRTLTH